MDVSDSKIIKNIKTSFISLLAADPTLRLNYSHCMGTISMEFTAAYFIMDLADVSGGSVLYAPLLNIAKSVNSASKTGNF